MCFFRQQIPYKVHPDAYDAMAIVTHTVYTTNIKWWSSQSQQLYEAILRSDRAVAEHRTSTKEMDRAALAHCDFAFQRNVMVCDWPNIWASIYVSYTLIYSYAYHCRLLCTMAVCMLVQRCINGPLNIVSVGYLKLLFAHSGPLEYPNRKIASAWKSSRIPWRKIDNIQI